MWFTVAAAATWQVDGSSLQVRRGEWPVRAAIACPAVGTETLGVAVVVYSRKQGTMAWGHVSLRTVACVEGALEDREFETYALSRWNLRSFREEHAGEAFLEGEFLDRQRGALVLFRNLDPVDRGWFADAEDENREIYELWLDLPPEELERVRATAEQWYATQTGRLRAGDPLPERYRALSTNCTTVLARTLPYADPPAMPFAWLRMLEERARMRVLHPSRHLVLLWDGALPDEVARPRPVFRRRGALPPELDVGAPIGPWTRSAATAD